MPAQQRDPVGIVPLFSPDQDQVPEPVRNPFLQSAEQLVPQVAKLQIRKGAPCRPLLNSEMLPNHKILLKLAGYRLRIAIVTSLSLCRAIDRNGKPNPAGRIGAGRAKCPG